MLQIIGTAQLLKGLAQLKQHISTPNIVFVYTTAYALTHTT